LEWVRDELPQIPMQVAGYGPRALGVAGRGGGGGSIPPAPPQNIPWIMDTGREAAEGGGAGPGGPQRSLWGAGRSAGQLARVAGRVGDGVIIQLADPQIIQWIMDTARKAAEEDGRDPDALQCIVCAPSHISADLADAREQVRWFPAMVSNHVMDLIERYGADS